MRTVHNNEKPFVCGFEGCGKSFGLKKVLQRHEWTHTQPPPHRERRKVVKEVGLIDELVGTGYQDTGRNIRCPLDRCEWLFTREYDLQRHIASMHRDALDDSEP